MIIMIECEEKHMITPYKVVVRRFMTLYGIIEEPLSTNYSCGRPVVPGTEGRREHPEPCMDKEFASL